MIFSIPDAVINYFMESGCDPDAALYHFIVSGFNAARTESFRIDIYRMGQTIPNVFGIISVFSGKMVVNNVYKLI